MHVYIQDIQFSSAIKRLTNTFPSIHAFSYPFRLQLLASPEVQPSFFKNFPPTQRLILPKIQKILQRFECVNDYTSCRTASACRKFNKALTIRRKYTQRCTWKRWHFAEWRTYWRKSYGWRGHKKVEYLSADRFPFHVFFFCEGDEKAVKIQKWSPFNSGKNKNNSKLHFVLRNFYSIWYEG